MEHHSGGCVSCIDSCLDPANCLASKLWKPFQVIVINPIYSAVILLALYVIFVIAYTPFWLISFLVSSWGSLFLFGYMLVWGLRAFARTISFPGSSKSLQRDFSLDYIRRTVQQIDMFANLSSNFAILLANSGKARNKLNHSSTKYEDPIMYKAAELEAWCDEMTHLHVCLRDAIEDYRYMAYNQPSSRQGAGNGGPFHTRRGSQSLPSTSASRNLQRGAAFTMGNLFSLKGLGKITEKSIDKLFSSVGICAGNSPKKKEEVNVVLNPAIVVCDSFGSLLEHTENLLRGISAKGNTHVSSEQQQQPQQQKVSTPPRRERSSSTSTSSSVGSPGNEMAEFVASISMVIRYSDQLRNALMYMLMESEHREEKRKEMSDRIAPVGNGRSTGQTSQMEGGEQGLNGLLEVSASNASNGGFLSNLTKQIAPGSQILNSIFYMNQGPRGPANLSFGLMRAQLTNRSGAYRFRVIGCDNNTIDCVYISAKGYQKAYGDRDTSSSVEGSRESRSRSSSETYTSSGSESSDDSMSEGGGSNNTRSGGASNDLSVLKSRSRSRSHSGYSSSVSKPIPSETGTVLFCGPNAGMYESFSMASPDSSWLGYYTQLGFDVAFFNYRGYNLSTGLPHPEGIQNDGIFVLEYLKTTLGVRNVLLHGESIGGMVATAIARHFDCSDSPPACEDDEHSVGASRDINEAIGLCSGAGSPSYENIGDIELASQYATHVTAENHKFRIKMLVCDRTFASLDSVAARFLGEWAAYGLVYLGPWHTDCVTPYLEANIDMKVIIQDPNDAIIDHSASLKTGVATYCTTGERWWWPRVPQSTSYRKSALLRQMPSFDPQVIRAPFKLDAAFIEAICVAITSLAQQTQSGVSESLEAGQPLDADTLSDDASTGSSLGSGRGAGGLGSSRGVERKAGRGQSLSMQSFRPTKDWLLAFCSQSVGEENLALTALEKALLVVASLDGRCGEMCGHALIGGFDNLFPFFCQLVHWSRRTFGSKRTISKSSSNHVKSVGRNIYQVCKDLHSLVYGQKQPNGLSSHVAVMFLLSAMEFIRDETLKVDVCALAEKIPGEDIAAGSSTTDSLAFYSPTRGKSVVRNPTDRLPATIAIGASLSEDFDKDLSGDKLQSEIPSVESLPSPSGPMSSGFLINVNCGHSGWPSKKALDMLTLCVHQAGFNVKKDQ